MKLAFVSTLIDGHSVAQPVIASLPLPNSMLSLQELVKQQQQHLSNTDIFKGEFERAFYIDSENEQIALSDDEDFKDAHRYQKQKGMKDLEVKAHLKKSAEQHIRSTIDEEQRDSMRSSDPLRIKQREKVLEGLNGQSNLRPLTEIQNNSNLNDTFGKTKKAKFSADMGQVESLQRQAVEAECGSKVTLKWKISNTSQTKAWPIYPQIKNFSEDNFLNDETSGNYINDVLRKPLGLNQKLEPSEHFIFELELTIPTFETCKQFQLILNLTNPEKDHEKFGDNLLAKLNITPQQKQPIPTQEEEKVKIDDISDEEPDLINEEKALIEAEREKKFKDLMKLIDNTLQDIDESEDPLASPVLESLKSIEDKDGNRRTFINEEEYLKIREQAMKEMEQKLQIFNACQQESHELSQYQPREKIEK